MTEVEQPSQNGIDLSADDESSKARPADIEQDMREMERRKRVETIMTSKLFRDELERIVQNAQDGGTSVLQQLSEMVGAPNSRLGSVFRSSACTIPINDIRGVESMGYAKGEKILRCKLAASFRLLDIKGWAQGLGAQITARLKVDQEYFLVNPYGLLFHEITASSLNKVDMQGQIIEQGTTNFGINKNQFALHSAVHAARPDIRCAIYIGFNAVVAISSLKMGLLPISKDACVLGEITTHNYTGSLNDADERDRLIRNLGPNSKVMLLTNHGALCCGETIEEAFFAAWNIVQASETQLKLLPTGIDNLVLIPEESRRSIYEQSRLPPEDLEKKFAKALSTNETATNEDGTVKENVKVSGVPKWRVGGAQFEALMRMLDNAGYRTGYIYRNPLVKTDPPKPKNDVELPPAVSSLGYLLEEEELFKQGIWKKGDVRKGGDRSRWLNSPNVYQKVEVLETGTPDPKKITKWVAEGSPTHSTPVRIEDPLQFVPAGTNPKEFKRLQQQIKDNRRADKISAGPQSHILEGVTWDEANRIKDATVSQTGDHVVLMGAASKGIIQRGYQHNATVYKAPYAKNPFDNVTDDELNEYKRSVEHKKKSIHGEYTDTDFSESEALSSLQTSGAQQQTKQITTTTTTAAISQSEPEDVSEHQVMRIETQQAPVPSQPEVVLSDDKRQYFQNMCKYSQDTQIADIVDLYPDQEKEHIYNDCKNIQLKKNLLIAEMKQDRFFCHQRRKIALPKSTCVHATPPALSAKSCSSYVDSGTGTFHNGYFYGNNISLPNIYFQSDTGSYNYGELPSQQASPTQTPIYDYVYDNAIPNVRRCNAGNRCVLMHFENGQEKAIYRRSSSCITPNVCESVFDTLRSQKQSELIFNIPFTPISSSTVSSSNTPRHMHFDITQMQHISRNMSPYRTVSHFGFVPPQCDPSPEHKHMPIIAEPVKYKPLEKRASYEEIFSSPRYVNVCDSCFDSILRQKPEIKQVKPRLCTIRELETPKLESSVLQRKKNVGNSSAFSDCNAKHVSLEVNDNFPSYSPRLEPVLEETEFENNNIVESNALITPTFQKLIVKQKQEESQESASVNKNVSNTSFIKKIMRLNYSEESTDSNFQKDHTISSNISVLPETEAEFSEIETIPRADANSADNCNADQQFMPKVTIMEIWEFDNWLERGATVSENSAATFGNSSESYASDYSEVILCDKNNNGNTKKQDICREPKRNRSLMSREERGRRKLIFQELWEDHIHFFDGKERKNSLSESELDTQKKSNKDEQILHSSDDIEVYNTQSFVSLRQPFLKREHKNKKLKKKLFDNVLRTQRVLLKTESEELPQQMEKSLQDAEGVNELLVDENFSNGSTYKVQSAIEENQFVGVVPNSQNNEFVTETDIVLNNTSEIQNAEIDNAQDGLEFASENDMGYTEISPSIEYDDTKSTEVGFKVASYEVILTANDKRVTDSNPLNVDDDTKYKDVQEVSSISSYDIVGTANDMKDTESNPLNVDDDALNKKVQEVLNNVYDIVFIENEVKDKKTNLSDKDNDTRHKVQEVVIKNDMKDAQSNPAYESDGTKNVEVQEVSITTSYNIVGIENDMKDTVSNPSNEYDDKTSDIVGTENMKGAESNSSKKDDYNNNEENEKVLINASLDIKETENDMKDIGGSNSSNDDDDNKNKENDKVLVNASLDIVGTENDMKDTEIELNNLNSIKCGNEEDSQNNENENYIKSTEETIVSNNGLKDEKILRLSDVCFNELELNDNKEDNDFTDYVQNSPSEIRISVSQDLDEDDNNFASETHISKTEVLENCNQNDINKNISHSDNITTDLTLNDLHEDKSESSTKQNQQIEKELEKELQQLLHILCECSQCYEGNDATEKQSSSNIIATVDENWSYSANNLRDAQITSLESSHVKELDCQEITTDQGVRDKNPTRTEIEKFLLSEEYNVASYYVNREQSVDSDGKCDENDNKHFSIEYHQLNEEVDSLKLLTARHNSNDSLELISAESQQSDNDSTHSNLTYNIDDDRTETFFRPPKSKENSNVSNIYESNTETIRYYSLATETVHHAEETEVSKSNVEEHTAKSQHKTDYWSSNSQQNPNISTLSGTENENNIYESDLYLYKSDDTVDNKDLENDENKEFSSLELQILTKIETNRLKESEEIFHKIDSSIRNKLTTTKIEEIVKEQLQSVESVESPATIPLPTVFSTPVNKAKIMKKTKDKSVIASKYNLKSSTPTSSKLEISQIGNDSFNILNFSNVTKVDETPKSSSLHSKSKTNNCGQKKRNMLSHISMRYRNICRSNSFIASRGRSSPCLKQKLNYTTPGTHIRTTRSLMQSSKKSSAPINSVHEMFENARAEKSLVVPRIKRNFILENIRSAGVPRQTRLNRTQKNANTSLKAKVSINTTTETVSDALIDTVTTAATADTITGEDADKTADTVNNEVANSTNDTLTGIVNDIATDTSSSTSVTSQPSVFSFQPKESVRGSPKFWFCLAPSTAALMDREMKRSSSNTKNDPYKLKKCESLCCIPTMESTLPNENSVKEPTEIVEESTELELLPAARTPELCNKRKRNNTEEDLCDSDKQFFSIKNIRLDDDDSLTTVPIEENTKQNEFDAEAIDKEPIVEEEDSL